MKWMFALFIAIFFSLMLIGCESNDETEARDIRIVDSEKVWPENFYEVAFRREEAPHYSYAVNKVSNQNDFEKTWKSFQLMTKRPQIDFNTKEILFLGVEESGSCPLELNSQDVKLTEQKITINLRSPDGNCTDDATQRTFVIEIPKRKSEEYSKVIVVEGGTESSISIKE
ncbi:hypothetical protein V7201_06290 [Bacillus sp. JJ1122]|uniref:hypothetical protein n=1 Tax=Bacillus sp. JJ1122 TaxID=3122951 RepID=UPI0030007849